MDQKKVDEIRARHERDREFFEPVTLGSGSVAHADREWLLDALAETQKALDASGQALTQAHTLLQRARPWIAAVPDGITTLEPMRVIRAEIDAFLAGLPITSARETVLGLPVSDLVRVGDALVLRGSPDDLRAEASKAERAGDFAAAAALVEVPRTWTEEQIRAACEACSWSPPWADQIVKALSREVR